MKPPHCLTQKCQKPNQLLSSWIALSAIAPEEYHQDQIAAYRTSISSKDVAFLYSKHKALCHSCNSSVINCFVCLSSGYLEQASLLLVNHLHIVISRTVHNTNNIPIGLCIICHEPFEIRVYKTKLEHHFVLFCPHDTLSFCGFKLHVTNCNGEHFVVHQVINMTSHGGPFLNTFDMIKHQPTILQITTRLHAPHQINPTY
jgi:hypothetical protein